ncbi:SDR family NAD(P)-dependent oxidoreductase [Roseicyclus persicicus]|uniref:SDR family NAD(P)-dependent oxidoreductase n=1 Tax=Roseicyclus persicicus TaxID=2650661 RepID=A0A7X6H118_9RHOB|nr:SDR family NAD(P)-dependent oxidoreductase [Roseibacterium persicicum]NKX44906.1 SDR family NAD(P)-dependent oxidoreductase [Roseibacterium persicicum]
MRDWSGKRYWLVGASEGLGRALALKMSRAGVELVLSARSMERLEALAAELPGRATCVAMDIADRDSVARAWSEVGEIDGMVFLAGVYWPVPATNWDAEAVETMFDVNLTGAARVLGHVVPAFVARNAGHIVLTGSLSGFRGLPGAIGYAASKAGLYSLAESLDGDLKDTRVDVQLVNPGFIKTRLTDKNDFSMPFIMEPEPAADIFFQHMCGSRFARSFPTLFSLAFRGSAFLPHGLYRRLFF